MKYRKGFECKQCKRKKSVLFKTKHGLNIHIAKVHRKKDDEDYNVNDDDGFLHECTYKNCDRCFESARALRAHIGHHKLKKKRKRAKEKNNHNTNSPPNKKLKLIKQ